MTRMVIACLMFLMGSTAIAGDGPTPPAPEAKLPNLPQPVARVYIFSASLQPPDVPGWIPLAGQAAHVTLARQAGGPQEGTALVAGIFKEDAQTTQDQFVAAWKALEDRANDADRFSIQDHTVTALQWKGAACLRSSIMVLDFVPHAPRDATNPMRIFGETLACQHPQDHGVVVYVSYTRRQTSNQVDGTFISEAGSVFGSLQFTPLVRSTARDDALKAHWIITAHGQDVARFGGMGNDFARKILCGPDGGCTLFGSSTGTFAMTQEFSITRLGADGKLQWAEALGGAASDLLLNASATHDGGSIVLGASGSQYRSNLPLFPAITYTRPVFLRLDPAGKVLWSGSLELGSDMSQAELDQAYQTADGGYLLAGSYIEGVRPSGAPPFAEAWSTDMGDHKAGQVYPYPLLVKLSAAGKPLWIRRYKGYTLGGQATTVMETPSGHLILTGSLYYEDAKSLFIMETDSQGAPLHVLRGTATQNLFSDAFLHLRDGRYVDIGHADLEHGARGGAFALFLSPDLKPMAATRYSAPASVRALSAVQGADDRICVVGRTDDADPYRWQGLAWLMDDHGKEMHELRLSGTGRTELVSALAQPDGSYRLFGDTEAFGAEGFDQVLTTWKPATGSDSTQLSVAPLFSQFTDIESTSSTALLDTIQEIPPTAFRITRFEAAQHGP